MERLRRHITITMDVDPTADSPLLSCKVHPKTCGIIEEDVKAMLSTSYGFQHYCIQDDQTQ